MQSERSAVATEQLWGKAAMFKGHFSSGLLTYNVQSSEMFTLFFHSCDPVHKGAAFSSFTAEKPNQPLDTFLRLECET